MRSSLAIVVALLLGACTTQPPSAALPPVTVSGPIFAATTFDCGQRPLPPNPETVAARAASAAAHYENRIGTWGQVCQNRLRSVGRELRAAGQVADPR